ncbi:hypothetical protein B0H19DRAFT_1074572 [Mycena capillaripes]|nr:hypothetical protein B0H19DRAFT_1074572 [Mycena capillaripes]
MPLSPLQSVGLALGSWILYSMIRSDTRSAATSLFPPVPEISQKYIDALLENKSATYSDRVGFHWHMAFMRYGQRVPKVFMQQFQPSEMLLHRPAELHAARVLLQRLLDSPSNMSGMVILSTVYGLDVQPQDDPYIDISEQALYAMARTGNRGSFLRKLANLDSLKYIPEFFRVAGFTPRQARE